jgi:dipeptidyl aminopeptidase/acylaminoacyl peptidase
LRKAGSPVTLVTYPTEGHEIASRDIADRHVRKALEFFRSALSAR